MNPLSLLLKNMVFTTLLVAMLFKSVQARHSLSFCHRQLSSELPAPRRKFDFDSADAFSGRYCRAFDAFYSEEQPPGSCLLGSWVL